jgi:endonuclease/exonuclease/phosphatase (EEP) superfamily protein YafD
MNRPAPSTIVPVAGDADERAISFRPSWWIRWLLAVAWLVTLALGACALLRLFFHDATYLLTWINAFTRYVYLPAYGCLLLALFTGRRWLAVANVGIIGCHLWWLAPDFLPDRRFAATTAAADPHADVARSLRIFFANVRMRNRNFEDLWDEIDAINPDIVLLVEFPPEWREALKKSRLLTKYRYDTGLDQVVIPNIVFSKLPLESIRHDWVANRCVETVEVLLGATTLRVVGLHAPRPMHVADNDYEGYWSNVIPLLFDERHPQVVVGDFNATQYSRVYQELRAGGLRSAHEVCGRGYATTWPNGAVPLPPIRIDQAFLSPDVVCHGITEGRGLGSDHKPLILDIEISAR